MIKKAEVKGVLLLRRGFLDDYASMSSPPTVDFVVLDTRALDDWSLPVAYPLAQFSPTN
jgi:hypothetical protein